MPGARRLVRGPAVKCRPRHRLVMLSATRPGAIRAHNSGRLAGCVEPQSSHFGENSGWRGGACLRGCCLDDRHQFALQGPVIAVRPFAQALDNVVRSVLDRKIDGHGSDPPPDWRCRSRLIGSRSSKLSVVHCGIRQGSRPPLALSPLMERRISAEIALWTGQPARGGRSDACRLAFRDLGTRRPKRQHQVPSLTARRQVSKRLST